MTQTRSGPTTESLQALLAERLAEAPDSLAGALTAMAGLLVDEEPLDDVLRRVADLAARCVPGCSGAGVTLMDGDRATTAAHTDELVLEVDAQQYAAGDGPCLDAIRHRRLNRVDLDAAEQRWPEFTAHARTLGVHSFLAAPLVAGGRPVGSLNLYGTGAQAFDHLDDTLVALFCGQASVALANARLYKRATDVNDQLSEALTSRAVIEQAKGVLVAQHAVTPDEAFAQLVERSQHANRKLRDVAAEVVAAAARG